MEKSKQYQIAVTGRFLIECDRLISRTLPQYRLAELLNMENPNLSRIRAGNAFATLEMICRMVEIFGTDPHWLLTGKRAIKEVGLRKKVA